MNRLDLESRILGSSPAAPASSAASPRPSSAPGNAFADALAAASSGVKFSGHAQTRIASRQIAVSGEDIAKLGDAMTRAAAKGSRETLMLTEKAAFVVSVPNRTVITAVEKSQLKENIFTNIDSAMIL